VRPVVLTIAGSDPSGGAGIQADLKTIEAGGGYALSALTAVTAQNSKAVLQVESVPSGLLGLQIDAVFDEFPVAAIKSGMLATSGNVGQVAAAIREHGPRPFVCDPVILSSSGVPLLTDEGVERLRDELVPLATLVTPNASEAERLSGVEVTDVLSAQRAAASMLERGARAVLIKGGHFERDRATDLLVTESRVERFSTSEIAGDGKHGSGCVYSAAIATRLAHGLSLPAAVESAKRFVFSAIAHGLTTGHGPGPADPCFAFGRDDLDVEAPEVVRAVEESR